MFLWLRLKRDPRMKCVAALLDLPGRMSRDGRVVEVDTNCGSGRGLVVGTPAFSFFSKSLLVPCRMTDRVFVQ